MNPDQTINLNQNTADCIKATAKFGETIYTNICNGNISHVSWGGADWAAALFLTIIGTAFLAVIVGMALYALFGRW